MSNSQQSLFFTRTTQCKVINLGIGGKKNTGKRVALPDNYSAESVDQVSIFSQNSCRLKHLFSYLKYSSGLQATSILDEKQL